MCDLCGKFYDAPQHELDCIDMGFRLLCSACKKSRGRDRTNDVTTPPVASSPPQLPPSPPSAAPPVPSPPAPEPYSEVEFMMGMVAGPHVRGCYGLACGTERDDEPAVHFGGLDDPRPGDAVITIELEEHAATNLAYDMHYRRVGDGCSLVEGTTGVCEAAD